MAKLKPHKQKLNTVATLQSYLMIAGSVIGMIVFVVIPLLWVCRFCVYSYKGYGTMKFVGLDQFVRAFKESPKFWLSVANTFIFAICKLAVEIPLALVLAFLLTRKIKGVTFFRSMYFMPSMVSVAIMGVVFTYLFAHHNGIINEFIKAFGGESIFFLMESEWFRPLYLISGIWQGIGWGTIIYLANLANVSPDLIEAARIDGATRWQVVWNINIPTILPTVIIMLILRVGGILGVGFEKVFLLQTNLNMSVSRVISTYTYERTLGAGGTTAYWDYSAAIGLFNTFINLALIMITNTISRKVGETSLF